MLKKCTIVIICTFGVIASLLWFTRERNRSAYAHCITSLKQIQAAKETWAVEKNKTKDDSASWSDLLGHGQHLGQYIPATPICPDGGTYRIGKVGEQVTCSIPEHKIQ